MTRVVRAMNTAGVTVFVALACSVIVLGTAPYDSGQRGFGHGAVSAAAYLEVAWTIAAVALAALRWKKTTIAFCIILALNAVVVFFLLRDLFVS